MSSFEEEWAQLKREAAARTVLASTDGPKEKDWGSGGRQGRLEVSEPTWLTAAKVAGTLRTSTNSALTRLATGQEGIGSGARGFASVSAQQAVHTSWRKRLEAVRDECRSLEGALREVGSRFGESERATEQSFRSRSAGRTDGTDKTDRASGPPSWDR